MKSSEVKMYGFIKVFIVIFTRFNFFLSFVILQFLLLLLQFNAWINCIIEFKMQNEIEYCKQQKKTRTQKQNIIRNPFEA